MVHPEKCVTEYNPDDGHHAYAIQALELFDVHIALEEAIEISFDRERGQNLAVQTACQGFVLSVRFIKECPNHGKRH